MYPKIRLLLALALVPTAASFAASAKSYQVTGPVVAVTPTTITIEKSGENWEITRDADAKSEPAVKVGDRVTVHYRMHATKIEAKPSGTDDGKKSDKASVSGKRKKSE